MKRVAIIQSNYLPWKGYFDVIASVDEFVFLDDVQYTRRDWRNRNRIKVNGELRWLTVPVEVKGRYHQRVDETRIADAGWADRHWRTLAHAYGQAPHFEPTAALLEPLYRELRQAKLLSEVNTTLVAAICDRLGIGTRLSRSTDHATSDEPSRRLLDLCLATSANEYVSGPAAREYLDVDLFEASGVRVSWFDYAGYPEYPQQGGDFEHGVSVVDLLFNTGPAARDHMLTAEGSRDAVS